MLSTEEMSTHPGSTTMLNIREKKKTKGKIEPGTASYFIIILQYFLDHSIRFISVGTSFDILLGWQFVILKKGTMKLYYGAWPVLTIFFFQRRSFFFKTEY